MRSATLPWGVEPCPCGVSVTLIEALGSPKVMVLDGVNVVVVVNGGKIPHSPYWSMVTVAPGVAVTAGTYVDSNISQAFGSDGYSGPVPPEPEP